MVNEKLEKKITLVEKKETKFNEAVKAMKELGFENPISLEWSDVAKFRDTDEEFFDKAIDLFHVIEKLQKEIKKGNEEIESMKFKLNKSEVDRIKNENTAKLNRNIPYEIKVVEKETSNGTKYNHIINLDGKEFTRNSIKKYNYILATKNRLGWKVVSYATKKETLNSMISYEASQGRTEYMILEVK